MSDKGANERRVFLTVAEAAEALGLSRLRVRDAVARGRLKARRDNKGFLRIDLPDGGLSDLNAADATDPAPDVVVGLLFDEVEELQAALADRDHRATEMACIAERQDRALQEAMRRLETSEGKAGRLAELLDRSLAHLESGSDREHRLSQVSEHAITRLEEVGSTLERSLAQSARFETLLERALSLAGGNTEAAQETPERALTLLEDALVQAGAGRTTDGQTRELLERALTDGERMQAEIAGKDAELRDRQEKIETTLAMLERVVALAERSGAQPQKRGFLRRLLGL